MKKLSTFLTALLLTLSCYGQKMDLVIKNAALFDPKTEKTTLKQTILIKDGLIFGITGNKKTYQATRTIDARGKLVTPGFIDTHIHPSDVYRAFGPLPELLPKDSLDQYRQMITDTFLPYGVTAAMIMGHPENWLPAILSWQQNPKADQLDIYTTSGALVTDQGRKPYVNHVAVRSPGDARQKVIDNYRLGLRHVKLYWKLRRPEFQAALETADSLKMKVFGHVDQNIMSIDTALKLGLRHFEHALTLVNTVFSPEADGRDFNISMQKNYGPGHGGAQLERLEMFRYIHENKPALLKSLIADLAAKKATLSTGIHLMAEPYGLTYFSNGLDNSLTPSQLARCRENFGIFMGYLKQCLDKGVSMRIGTDWPNGGKAFLSEQLLLSEYGFTTSQILKMSTLSGAEAMEIQSTHGSIEKGKRADLVIFERSPFISPKNFLGPRTVIKDGKIQPD